jgi:hypothetical protein
MQAKRLLPCFLRPARFEFSQPGLLPLNLFLEQSRALLGFLGQPLIKLVRAEQRAKIQGQEQ